ncbi:hypothetical protein [Sphaerisporangium dianthi]|uniref:DUF4333 domain-containing protein n=1 Tax=Sphaerisporangium dianthi TaxID=1436120 RepID=A0ABV9CA86_9ACTN
MTRRMWLTVLVSALAILSSGCGGAGGSTPTPRDQAGSGRSESAAPAETSCGGVAEKVEKHVRRPEILSVTIAGQCTSLSIKTDLDDGKSGTAERICEAAAEVAYTGDTNAIRVLGGSGKELSVGIAGARCLAQP